MLRCGGGTTGAHREDPGRSAPALERWASHLASKCKAKSNIGNYTKTISHIFFEGVTSLSYIMPTACHNFVDSFIGQLGAVETKAV